MKSERLNWIWFHPSSRRMGMVQMKGLTRVVDCESSVTPQARLKKRGARILRFTHLTHGSSPDSLKPGTSSAHSCRPKPVYRDKVEMRICREALEVIPAYYEPRSKRDDLETLRRAKSRTYLNLEGKVLLQILDYHDEERKLDSQRLLGVARTSDIDGGNLLSWRKLMI